MNAPYYSHAVDLHRKSSRSLKHNGGDATLLSPFHRSWPLQIIAVNDLSFSEDREPGRCADYFHGKVALESQPAAQG